MKLDHTICSYGQISFSCTISRGSPSPSLSCLVLFSFSGGARGVMVIAVGNGHGDTSSNPG